MSLFDNNDDDNFVSSQHPRFDSHEHYQSNGYGDDARGNAQLQAKHHQEILDFMNAMKPTWDAVIGAVVVQCGIYLVNHLYVARSAVVQKWLVEDGLTYGALIISILVIWGIAKSNLRDFWDGHPKLKRTYDELNSGKGWKE